MSRAVVVEEWRAALNAHDAARLRFLARQARPADVAEVIGLLDADEGNTVLRALPRNAAAVSLSLLPESTRTDLLDILSDQLLTDLIAHLPPDDAVDLLYELPPDQARALLRNTLHEQSEKLRELMDYGEDTAGGLMTNVLIALPETATVAAAVDEIRRVDLTDDEFFNVYVIDRRGRLVGLVPIASLLTRPADTPLGQIMSTDIVTVGAEEDQEAVVHLCRKHDLSVVPVVGPDGAILGRITTDDILDAADEEAEEDLYRMAGTDPAELETTSPLRAARIRGIWLVPCVAGCLFVAGVLFFFEAHIRDEHRILVLAFIPLIAAMGGNTGIQTSTGVVRALAIGGRPESRIAGAFTREFPIAALLAVGLALLCAGATALIGLNVGGGVWQIGYMVGISMWVAVTVSTSLGIALPFLFQRLGVDPAIASGPIITTSNDLISITIYLSVCVLLLPAPSPLGS